MFSAQYSEFSGSQNSLRESRLQHGFYRCWITGTDRIEVKYGALFLLANLELNLKKNHLPIYDRKVRFLKLVSENR